MKDQFIQNLSHWHALDIWFIEIQVEGMETEEHENVRPIDELTF